MNHKIVLTLLLVVGLAIGADAAELPEAPVLDAPIIEVYNAVIMDIYAAVMASKPEFKELRDFGEENLSVNPQGIYAIEYAYQPDGTDRTELPYQFAVTIDPVEAWTFPAQSDMFNYAFPILQMKISGYQRRHPLRKQFDVIPFIRRYGERISKIQQEHMPLMISVRPVADTVEVGANVEVDVVLTNVSKRHMYVAPLSDKTLYFLIDDQYWGTPPGKNVSVPATKILYAGESLTMRYQLGVFHKPQVLEVTCHYRMGIRGVTPYGQISLPVVAASQSPAVPLRNDP